MRFIPGKFLLILLVPLLACGHRETQSSTGQLAIRIRHDVKRSWDASWKNAVGNDLQLPADAFSTLVLAGLTEDADQVISCVADSFRFDQNMSVRVFEMNIQVLGGLLSMYQLSGDEQVLEKAVELGTKLMPAFKSVTGIPYAWVNLETGFAEGRQVSVAAGGTFLLEMGMLSYFTADPRYYQAAKQSSRAIFDRRSEIGLLGELIDVETGEWINPSSHIGAGIDSFIEYLYKGWILFGDPELKRMWDECIEAVLKYIPDENEGRTWYGHVNMDTGDRISSVVHLSDAFMPSLLVLSGHTEEAVELQASWDWLWNRYGLVPMGYDYEADSILDARYELNAELIESAWYLREFTREDRYLKMIEDYYADLLKYCSKGVAFSGIQDVKTMEKSDHMPDHFLAETLKYFYLAFASQDMYKLATVVFSTEAQPFLKAALDPGEVRKNLGIQ